MKKRILTGITTTGTPHIGNYLGAIKPSLNLATENPESFFFLADYHALIKNKDSQNIKESVKNVALAWLSSGLDTDRSYFYRQSDIKEVTELSWILSTITAKGLMNRAHAYKAATAENKSDEDKGINMGLFSYPILMATDILIFNSTHVPVGADQLQHLEMTRDIAQRFNHLYKSIFNIPEAIVQEDGKVVPGLDGKKMSKSYNNIIPLLSDEKTLKKSIAKIVTNSLEPGEPKETENCTVFNLFSHFASRQEQEEFKAAYKEGISWGDAKSKLFEAVNSELSPIRERFNELSKDNNLVNDLLDAGAKKVKPLAQDMLGEVRELVGISKIG
ncbi:MAG: tryptophan--tRNA ligase [Gammaproteobacteria bacterium]